MEAELTGRQFRRLGDAVGTIGVGDDETLTITRTGDGLTFAAFRGFVICLDDDDLVNQIDRQRRVMRGQHP